MTTLSFTSPSPFPGVAPEPTSAEGRVPTDDDVDFMIDGDLSYFKAQGLARLLGDMLKQSLKDIIEHRDNKHAPAEVSMSANWPKSECGMMAIEFLMPSASPDRVIARIYQEPEKVLDGFLKVAKQADQADVEEKDGEPKAQPAPGRTLRLEEGEAPAYEVREGILERARQAAAEASGDYITHMDDRS